MTLPGPVLGLVPARGGSKGIPGKNLKPLGGRPLLRWTLDAARAAGVCDRLVLTTDSDEIAAAGRAGGAEVPFLRPAELARDETPMKPVIAHALDALAAEGFTPWAVLLLQPTAPLRRPELLREALATLATTGADAVVSVVPVPEHYLPHFVLKLDHGRLRFFLPEGERITRRQDAPRAYSRDGSVYAFRADSFRRHGSIYGEDCRPLLLAESEGVNLDSEDDWRRAEALIAARG